MWGKFRFAVWRKRDSKSLYWLKNLAPLRQTILTPYTFSRAYACVCAHYDWSKKITMGLNLRPSNIKIYLVYIK